MKLKFLLILTGFGMYQSVLSAQLKPFIGLSSLPQLTDPVCPIQNYLGDFSDSGYHPGDTVHDFTLYNIDNNSWSLSEHLKSGKPVLLISSSYTCPIFRGKIPRINELNSRYSSQLEIIVVYTVEAHPDKDISPYFGRVNTGSANTKEGILYRQPTNYGERIKILTDMLASENLEVPVYVDGPCNEWWYHYGPAPNNATLIDTNGIVQLKHAWLDREPDNIICDVQKYFNPAVSCDSIPSGIGSFSFRKTSDTVITGEVNTLIYVTGIIQNESDVPVTIEIRRLLNNMPPDWTSSICLDLCYAPEVDSTQITLRPKERMDLIIDFFTGPIPAQGSVRLGMRNVDNFQNKYIMNGKAITQYPTTTFDAKNKSGYAKVFPNPTTNKLHVQSPLPFNYELYNQIGVLCKSGNLPEKACIEKENLPPGNYYLKLITSGRLNEIHTVILK